MHTHTDSRQWIIGSNQVPHNRIYLPLSHKALAGEMSTLWPMRAGKSTDTSLNLQAHGKPNTELPQINNCIDHYDSDHKYCLVYLMLDEFCNLDSAICNKKSSSACDIIMLESIPVFLLLLCKQELSCLLSFQATAKWKLIFQAHCES